MADEHCIARTCSSSSAGSATSWPAGCSSASGTSPLAGTACHSMEATLPHDDAHDDAHACISSMGEL